MRIDHYPGGGSGARELAGTVYRVFGGAMYNPDNEVERRTYLNAYDHIAVMPGDLLEVQSIINDGPRCSSHILAFDTLEPVALPYVTPRHFSDLYWVYNDAYFVYSRHREGGVTENVYVDRQRGRHVILPSGGWKVFDDQHLVVRDIHGVRGHTWDGEERWRYPLPNFRSLGLGLNDYHDSVIFQTGCDDATGQSHLVRLHKARGEVLWKKTFASWVENTVLLGDKLYVAEGNRMSVLAAADGATLCTFTADEPPDASGTTLWSDGQLLYVFSEQSNRMLCYSLDGSQCLQRYTFPARPCILSSAVPRTLQGTHYLTLGDGDLLIRGAELGVFSWTTEEVLAGEPLEVEEKPAVTIMTVKEGKAESYWVTVPGDRLSDILRFGEITARLIAALRGKQSCLGNEETRNKKFNGQIKLLIDPEVGKDSAPYLDVLAKRVNFYARRMTGRGGKPIEVSWAFWDEV